MNKKASHVDWAISMGIFLVYIIGMFILLRPGVTPVHKPEGLLEILENKFNKEVMWEVREIPLFVEFCFGDTNNPATITVEDEGNNFKFGKVVCEKFSGGTCPDPYNKEQSGGNRFSIECLGMDGEKPNLGDVKFTLMYHLKTLGDKSAAPKLTSTESLCKDGIEDCEAFLGASTSKEGINSDWLNGLRIENKELKELIKDLDFPDEKEFSIYEVYSGQDPIFVNGIKEKPQGVNVFTKEIKTNILETDGDLNPVTISLQVW